MKVFVSSTYIDLKEHREAVDEIINRLSLQYRGLEYFGSRPFEPSTVCFDEIDQCKIFVGIYAHRYGFVPDGQTLSITEQEFDYARARSLDCYCYVVDPEHPWPPPFIEQEASQRLQRLASKVSSLVRSTFTTPDNLAKQIAADLQLAIKRSVPAVDGNQLLRSLQDYCKQEIITTVGAKYIRELYVGRKLNKSLKKELKRLQQITRMVKSTKRTCENFRRLLAGVNIRKLGRNQRKPLHRVRRALRAPLDDLAYFGTLQFPHPEISYPANRLNAVVMKIKDVALDAQRSIPRRLFSDPDSIGRWDDVCQHLVEGVNASETALRPISLIVDRAGGGKTNLLCRLAEELGDGHLCFFLAAKSIPHATEAELVHYLSSVYPIGKDPIEVALTVTAQINTPVVVVVDGINESLDPARFNAAFKALVRRYYSKPILYVVSCRDIYWNYFEDAWWQAHCNLISRDELYEFTTNEFRKALPLYLNAYDIEVVPVGDAREQLHHPLLLRFYCEAFRGQPGQPAKLGKLEDIRLLELFDAYCERKFSQIKERLGLVSSAELFDYLKVIARLMLTERTRLLHVKRIAYHMRREFNEQVIHSIDSRYVQILDEDILLEQKPSGPEMDLMVGFVYDEFMEYMIAKALWSDMCGRVNEPQYEEVRDVANALLEEEVRFMSVLGVVVYLGELLATQSQPDALMYVDWLTAKGRESLACRLIGRWPLRMLDDAVFLKLIDLHRGGRTKQIQLEAWHSMETLCIHHWKVFFEYLSGMPLTGYFRPMYVFSLLGRVNGGSKSTERLATIKWMVRVMKERIYMSKAGRSGDDAAGVTALRRIMARTAWSKIQLKEAEELLRSVVQ